METNVKRKVLLMGKSGSGKTSMRSIIFANYIAKDTTRLAATIDVERSQVGFLGDLTLNLWDCGGQEAFMENYFSSQRDHIFTNVAVLIYVFDVESSETTKDMQYFYSCMEAIRENSPEAKVFVLVHKMDLISEDHREATYQDQAAHITQAALPMRVTCFPTSIWDETLYRAWSDIVHDLIPNIQKIEQRLTQFGQVCGADEVVIFERATFLVLSHASIKEHRDAHRFEKISNIVKQFKLSCAKSRANFERMEVGNSLFTAFIDEFTPTTYVMVIISDPSISPSATLLNINQVSRHFEKYIPAHN